MKKYLIIILCLILALSFAACSGDDSKKRDTSDKDRADYTEPTIWQPKDKQTVTPSGEREKSSRSGTNKAAPTDEMLEALETAEYYLDSEYYSYSNLIRTLEDAGYSHEAAVYAARNCGADWKDQAYEMGMSYLEYWDPDYTEMLEYLQSMGFTYAEAHDAASKLCPEGDEEETESDAVADADDYTAYYSFSRDGLYQQLLSDGYSKSEAKYAVENCDADWYDEALELATDKLDEKSYTYDELVEWLMDEGFSKTEAEYGAYYAKVNA